MNNTIHKNLAAAKIACEKYITAISNLQAALGVWEENEDSSVVTYTYAKYYDEDGNVKIYIL